MADLTRDDLATISSSLIPVMTYEQDEDRYNDVHLTFRKVHAMSEELREGWKRTARRNIRLRRLLRVLPGGERES
jgi:hypothetical protein